jgi:hypothetical protein
MVLLLSAGGLLVAGYFAIDVMWSSIHPQYRHASTAEFRWPANPTFQSCWQDRRMQITTGMGWFDSSNTPHVCDALGTFIPVNNDPAMVLTVTIPRADPAPPGAPSMQIALTSLCGVRTEYFGENILPQVYGDPPIVCDLNASQAAFVQQNGVPQTLIDAMQAAAQNAGWKPINPSGVSVYPGPQVNINPKPHIP